MELPHKYSNAIHSEMMMMMTYAVGYQRPWPELENKMQIMFKVGMGNLPKIPETLSSEGQAFLGHCLQFNPDDRWTASQLKGDLFVSVSNICIIYSCI